MKSRRPTEKIQYRMRVRNRTAFIFVFLFILSGFSPAFAGGNANINVSATILSNSNCKFDTGNATLPFGNLDPGNPVVVNASTSFQFRCMGAAGTAVFVISQDGGLNPLGPQNQMHHLTAPAYLMAYSLSLVHVAPPIPKNVWQTLTINGTVTGAAYQPAPPGDYEDTVVVSILP